MKSIFFTCFICIFSITTSAQNVGIGTSSPAESLTITDATEPMILIGRNSPNNFRSGQLIFAEDINALNYTGFGFNHDGSSNFLYLTGRGSISATIAVFRNNLPSTFYKGMIINSSNAESVSLELQQKLKMPLGASNGHLIQSDAEGVMSWVSPSSVFGTSFPSTAGSPGDYLVSDASGTLAWKGSAFERSFGVIRQIENINDDFILGRSQLPGEASASGTMLFYDKSKSAIRIGELINSQNWAPSKIGLNSIANGKNNLAEGDGSAALGVFLTASSYAEVALGGFNTSYSAASKVGWNSNDRLLVVGNGSTTVNRKDALSLWKSGKLGIGESLPDSRVHIKSIADEDPLRVNIGNETVLYVHANGGITNHDVTPNFALKLQNSATDIKGRGQAYSWNTYSDRRIKSNIMPINYGLNTIMKLEPMAYDHHDSTQDQKTDRFIAHDTSAPDIGLIAQEVHKLVPEAVSKPEKENELWSMDYTRLIPVLIKGMQEQQEMIAALKKEIEILKKTR